MGKELLEHQRWSGRGSWKRRRCSREELLEAAELVGVIPGENTWRRLGCLGLLVCGESWSGQRRVLGVVVGEGVGAGVWWTVVGVMVWDGSGTGMWWRALGSREGWAAVMAAEEEGGRGGG